MKILVARTDKLGDMMLAWPALALLRKAMPEATIGFLVSSYTAELAALCPYVDDVIVDEGERANELALKIRSRGYDAAVSLFNTMRICAALYRAEIPYRLGPASKVSQLFLSKRLRQRRSQSIKPEYCYNEDLVVRALRDLCGYRGCGRPTGPHLRFPPAELAEVRLRVGAQSGISPDSPWVIVHPGSGGSANNLSTGQYANLINQLDSGGMHSVLVTAGPGELEAASEVRAMLAYPQAGVYGSNEGIIPFAKLIAASDIFVSGSTGPLHVAGVLNKATAGFYPAKRSSTALRWQTPNDFDKRLSFQAHTRAEEGNGLDVDIGLAALQISALLLDMTAKSCDAP